MLTAHTIALSAAFLLALLSIPALHAQSSSPPDPKAISVIDGEIGPCSAEFTVTDNAGAPVYGATIKVHIAWGFMNARKLDLEVGTNASGKARFIGLPAKPKQGLFFRASDGSREGSAFDDPVKACTAQFTIVLEKKTPTAQLRARSETLAGNPEAVSRGRFPEVVDRRIVQIPNLFWRMRPPSPMIIPISMRTET